MARTKVDDLISRRMVIDDIKAMYEWHDVVTEDRLIEHMKMLPAAEREPGKWLRIKGEQSYVCRDCGQRCLETIMLLPKWDYCPNCGAYMGDEND